MKMKLRLFLRNAGDDLQMDLMDDGVVDEFGIERSFPEENKMFYPEPKTQIKDTKQNALQHLFPVD